MITEQGVWVPETIHVPGAAEKLSMQNDEHLVIAAGIINEGGIGAIGFNGPYGLFGHAHRPEVAEKIHVAKNRPLDRKLILTAAPEDLGEYVDLKACHYSLDQMVELQKRVHALGLRLPASEDAPGHLVLDGTIVNIWTEYEPMRKLMRYHRELGGKAFVGTSANKSGQPTHFRADEVWGDFKQDVDFVLLDGDYDHLPEKRRMSTSIIDLTTDRARLHREGNVTEDELRPVLKGLGFGDLQVDERTIRVKPRA